ncbi:transmembrane protease serine 6 [Halyomorpha halys]|uniref:transmembrane protease serine 6 n=1 Tax=Halyomorpha halys TaxID=286706 RepID=UPI0006D5180B
MMDPYSFSQHNPYIHRCPGEKRREKDPLQPCCSLLTILVLFLVLLGVLAVSGLALYIGALRLEPAKTLMVFDGSMRLLGDKFSPGLANKSGLQFYQKSRRYQTLLEALYGKSRLGPALHDIFITSFANGSLIIFFRIILDRRKIPKPIGSIEDTLRNVILEEASSALSVLNTLKIDPKQLHIKRYLQERDQVPNHKEETPNLQTVPKKKLRLEPTSTKRENIPPLRLAENTEEENTQSVKEEEWRLFNDPSASEGRGFQGEAEVVQDVPNLPIVGEFPDIVTLLPVRSNVAVRPALRPKPPKPYEEEPKLSLQSYFPDDFVTESSRETSHSTSVEPFLGSTVALSQKPKNHRRAKSVDIPTFQNFSAGLEAEMKLLLEEIFINMSSKTNEERQTTLSPVSIKEMTEGLDKLAKLKVSHKAVANSHHSNVPFTLMTKVLSKAPVQSQRHVINATTDPQAEDCGENAMLCNSGECIPLQLRCNKLADCRDSSDEKNCTCAQMLKAQLQASKICDGIDDCADRSDEAGCDWCQSDHHYACSNAKICIDHKKVCDGISHCPYGDDEVNCILLKNGTSEAYNEKGQLMLKKNGVWGKLCLQNFGNNINNSSKDWDLQEFGHSICGALTFQKLVSIHREKESNEDMNQEENIYYEITSVTHNSYQKTNISAKYVFEETTCPEKEIATIECNNLSCGQRATNNALWFSERKSRIVGGGNAGPGSWPWQAALYKEGEFQCGGTLISDQWIISAAHCFYRAEDDYWVARLGVLRRGGPPSLHEQLRHVANIFLHPSYQDLGYLHDICLLRLQSPLIMTAHVRPICLPTTDVSTGRLCTVIGWGQLSEAGRLFPDTLQEVEIPIISTAECRKRTGGLPLYRLTDDMFCAGFERGGRDACLGDSGGPLMCQESDGHWMLHGVTSNGYGCARANRPGVYTKVKAYLKWIGDTLQNSTATPTNTTRRCAGHRCPLGECLPPARVCNGYTECSDSSDEALCW